MDMTIEGGKFQRHEGHGRGGGSGKSYKEKKKQVTAFYTVGSAHPVGK